MNLCLSHVINQLSGRDLSGSCISGARFFLPLFLSFLFSMRRSMSAFGILLPLLQLLVWCM